MRPVRFRPTPVQVVLWRLRHSNAPWPLRPLQAADDLWHAYLCPVIERRPS